MSKLIAVERVPLRLRFYTNLRLNCILSIFRGKTIFFRDSGQSFTLDRTFKAQQSVAWKVT